MYLNYRSTELIMEAVRLTLTWDVFKFDGNQVNASMITRLTLTWDVFKW